MVSHTLAATVFSANIWISGLAILSALIVFFLVKPLDHDGMNKEDQAVSLFYVSLCYSRLRCCFMKFREYLEQHGFDTSQMGLIDDSASTKSAPSITKESTEEKTSAV